MSIEEIIEMLENKKQIYSLGITVGEFYEEMNFLISLLQRFKEQP